MRIETLCEELINKTDTEPRERRVTVTAIGYRNEVDDFYSYIQEYKKEQQTEIVNFKEGK